MTDLKTRPSYYDDLFYCEDHDLLRPCRLCLNELMESQLDRMREERDASC